MSQRPASASRRILRSVLSRTGGTTPARPSPARMEELETRRLCSIEAFLAIPGATGPVQTSGFQGQFLVDRFDFKGTDPLNGEVTGPAVFSDIAITKGIDAETPNLLGKVGLTSTFAGLGTLTLTVVNESTTSSKTLMVMTLSGVAVADDQLTFADSSLGQEQLTLSYSQLTFAGVTGTAGVIVKTTPVFESLSQAPAPTLTSGSDEVFIHIPGVTTSNQIKFAAGVTPDQQLLVDSGSFDIGAGQSSPVLNFRANDQLTFPRILEDIIKRPTVSTFNTTASYVTVSTGSGTAFNTLFTFTTKGGDIASDQIDYVLGNKPSESVSIQYLRETVQAPAPAAPAIAVKAAVNIPVPAPALAIKAADAPAPSPAADLLDSKSSVLN